MQWDLILPLAGIGLVFLAVFWFLGSYFVTMHSTDKKSKQRQDKLLNSRWARAIRTTKNVRRILGTNKKYGED